MWDFFVREFSGRGAATLLAFLLGGPTSRALGLRRRRRERQSLLRGDARDTVVIEHHLVEATETPDPEQPGRTRRVPSALRIRTLGQSELGRVVPNSQLAADFRDRAWRATAQQTLISMEGSEGSFLLETLTGFVGDRVGNGGFEHDLYVMAPCCEPRELAHHQPIVILLIAASHLADELGVGYGRFKEWVRKGYVHARRVGGRKHLVIWADAEERERLRRLRDAFRPGQPSPYPAELTRPKARPDQGS